MSESRQRLTGNLGLFFLGFGLLWLVFVTLPFFTRYLQVKSIEPRLMTVDDLTWQRFLYNFLSKPGIRAGFVLGLGLVGVVILGWWRGQLTPQFMGDETTSEVFWVSSTAEWVIDGRRQSSLIEFGRFIGVL